MKKLIVVLMVFISVWPVACSKTRIITFPEIDCAGKGSYSINDIAVVSGNRGPISIKGENSGGQQYVYMTGSYRGADGSTRCLTAKFDENGKPLWHKLYPESEIQGARSKVSYGMSVQVNADGGLKEEDVYVLAGEGAGNEQKQLILLKYDSLGGKLLERNLAQSKYDIGGLLYTDNAANLYCAGYMKDKDNVTEIFSYKCSPSGDPIWSSSYLNPKLHCQHVIFQLQYPDQLICAGVLGDQNDLFYIPFNPLGKALDMVVCHTSELENALADFITDERGSIYLTANHRWGFSTVAYDNTDKMRWHATFNDSTVNYNRARSIAIDDYGSVYVAGSGKGQQSSDRLVLVKYDTTGTELWRNTDILIPGEPWGPWFINPEFIHNRFQCRPASDMDMIGCTKNSVFIARYNTMGFKKAFAQHRVEDRVSFVGAVDGKFIAVNSKGEDLSDIRKAQLLKYEEIQIFGINRWD